MTPAPAVKVAMFALRGRPGYAGEIQHIIIIAIGMLLAMLIAAVVRTLDGTGSALAYQHVSLTAGV